MNVLVYLDTLNDVNLERNEEIKIVKFNHLKTEKGNIFYI